MIRQPTAYLLLNGSIVILAGLLTCFPLKSAILRKRENLNAWRIAHSVLVMDGLFMLIVGMILPHLPLEGDAASILVWSLTLSGYGFVAAFTLGALKRIRGLTVKPYGLNTVLFAAHSIGTAGSLVGASIMIYGSLRTFF
jgi:hypothetical protein